MANRRISVGAYIRRRLLATVLALVASTVMTPGYASAFGTIDGAGQHREHERITRAALACASHVTAKDGCFQPRSIDQLAGHGKAFGGVGAPDSDEISNPSAHCDGADFLGPRYPRTREQATKSLIDCIDHLRARFREAVDSAKDLVDNRGRVVAEEVSLASDCRLFEDAENRVKCTSLEALGRALHGAQDFYAHSNWADEADPSRPVGVTNPPGLNLLGPSPVLDLRNATRPQVPATLITGCFVLRDEVSGVGECTTRVTHAALNKDNGLIDPVTGATTDPTTLRGMVKDNFAKAVAGAIAESGRQWQDYRSELEARYGGARAALMVCALTHDDPVSDCAHDTGTSSGLWIAFIVVLLVATVVLAVAITRFRPPRSSW